MFDVNSARGYSLPSLCWPFLIEVQIVSREFCAVNAVKGKSDRSDSQYPKTGLYSQSSVLGHWSYRPHPWLCCLRHARIPCRYRAPAAMSHAHPRRRKNDVKTRSARLYSSRGIPLNRFCLSFELNPPDTCFPDRRISLPFWPSQHRSHTSAAPAPSPRGSSGTST